MSPGRDLMNVEARRGSGGWLTPVADGVYQPLRKCDDLGMIYDWGLPHSPKMETLYGTQMEMLDGLGKVVIIIYYYMMSIV